MADRVAAALQTWFANTSKGWRPAMSAVLDRVLPVDDASLLAIAQSRRCGTCDGYGWVANPEARYVMDYVEHMPTGYSSTSDPEEIDCPDCGGVGFVRPRPIPEPITHTPAQLDEDFPF